VELRHPLKEEMIRLTNLPKWAEGMDPSVLFMDFD